MAARGEARECRRDCRSPIKRYPLSLRVQRYHLAVRQLISRIDDELHLRLKTKAVAEDRSLNDLVTQALEDNLKSPDERAQMWARLAVRGARVVPPRPSKVPSAGAIEKITRGAGTVASDALAAQRGER